MKFSKRFAKTDFQALQAQQLAQQMAMQQGLFADQQEIQHAEGTEQDATPEAQETPTETTAETAQTETETKAETATDTTAEDNTKLLEALKKERQLKAEADKQRKALEKQLQAFQGIDPDLAKKAEAILQEQQQREDWETQVKQSIEAEYLPRLTQAEQERDQAIAQLHNYQMDSVLERAAIKAECFANEYHLIAPLLKSRAQFDPKTGTVKVVDASGKPVLSKGEPMTVDALIEELKAKDMGFARHFRAADASGAGINGRSAQPIENSSIGTGSAWDKLRVLRERQGL